MVARLGPTFLLKDLGLRRKLLGLLRGRLLILGRLRLLRGRGRLCGGLWQGWLHRHLRRGRLRGNLRKHRLYRGLRRIELHGGLGRGGLQRHLRRDRLHGDLGLLGSSGARDVGLVGLSRRLFVNGAEKHCRDVLFPVTGRCGETETAAAHRRGE